MQTGRGISSVDKCNKNFHPFLKREKRLYLKTKQHRCETLIEQGSQRCLNFFTVKDGIVIQFSDFVYYKKGYVRKC